MTDHSPAALWPACTWTPNFSPQPAVWERAVAQTHAEAAIVAGTRAENRRGGVRHVVVHGAVFATLRERTVRELLTPSQRRKHLRTGATTAVVCHHAVSGTTTEVLEILSKLKGKSLIRGHRWRYLRSCGGSGRFRGGTPFRHEESVCRPASPPPRWSTYGAFLGLSTRTAIEAPAVR